MVRVETAGGSLQKVARAPFNARVAILRIRREGNFLFFDQRLSPGEWSEVHNESLSLGTTADRGGLFTSTSLSQEVRIGFDYLFLVDPSVATDHTNYLRITEVMYHPVGDNNALEYIELTNIGPDPLNLEGVSFQGGSPFDELVLPNFVLNPGDFVVVVSDILAFRALYGNGITIVAEWSGGTLSDSGERILLRGPLGNVIHDFTYGEGGSWPEQADGQGFSLVADKRSELGFRVSVTPGGSPGSDNSDFKPADDLVLTLTRLANGMLRVSFAGVQGRSYSLQASLALDQEWQPLTTFFPETSGKVSRTISPRVSRERFFRLVTPANP